MIQKLSTRWMDQYYNTGAVLLIPLATVIALAFVLSDWLLGAFTFTEYILGVSLLFSLVIGKFIVYRYQLKFITILLVSIVVHTGILMMLDNEVDLRLISISLIKLVFYLILTTWIINLMRGLRFKEQFLFIINCLAVIVFLIGLYIALAIYLNLHYEIDLPYEFLLRFTRLDGHLFRRDIPIVRMKSIFEEPAHLGYYFNSILMTNFFGRQNLRYNWLFNSVLIIGIILTFSYSSIAILIIILTVKFIMALLEKKINVSWSLTMIAVSTLIIVILFVFRDVLYTTFISRTMELISGTETSGYERLFDSWRYINRDDLFIGIGFMQTPGALWNNFAYFTTEFGLVGLIGVAAFNMWVFSRNKGLGVIFLFMNFAKGGYLSSSYWFLILLVLLYSIDSKQLSYTRKEEYFEIK